MRATSLEALKDKFGFVSQLPYKAAAIYLAELSPEKLQRAMQVAAQCIRMYDEAVVEHGVRCIHRVARTLFDPSFSIRKQLDHFRSTPTTRLTDYPKAVFEIMFLARCPMSTRKVEEPHGRAKKFTSWARAALPAATCVELPHHQCDELIVPTAPSYQFVCMTWRRFSIRRQLLDHLSDIIPQRATFNQILALVYPYHLDMMFEDVDVSKHVLDLWTDRAFSTKAPPLKWHLQLPIQYKRARLEVCSLLSLPKDSGVARQVSSSPWGVALERIRSICACAKLEGLLRCNPGYARLLRTIHQDSAEVCGPRWAHATCLAEIVHAGTSSRRSSCTT